MFNETLARRLRSADPWWPGSLTLWEPGLEPSEHVPWRPIPARRTFPLKGCHVQEVSPSVHYLRGFSRLSGPLAATSWKS